MGDSVAETRGDGVADGGLVSRMSAAPRHREPVRSRPRPGVRLSRDGIEIAVHAQQKPDQLIAFILMQAGEQPTLTLQGNANDAVVGRAASCGQRNGMAATVLRIGGNGDQTVLPHHSQRPADRSLVEADDLTDSGGRNSRFNGQQRQDAPFGYVDPERLLIKRRRTARQLVGDEGDQGRHIAVEVENPTSRRGRSRWCRPGRVMSVLSHSLANRPFRYRRRPAVPTDTIDRRWPRLN